ncbi:MAG TPA: class I SAM-dependent methyltransferase [Steroidobacteraceae bacterium]|nr:class I SAM-dependent methyltransferase [Steroidobacteraceae bacterium]
MKARAPLAALVDAASAPYRCVDRFAYYHARGKFNADPAFEGMLRGGWLAQARTVLDLGCGQGLLASWLLSAGSPGIRGEWPVDWPPPPRPEAIRGIEMREQAVRRARDALGERAEFLQGDIAHTGFGAADAVIIMDVLHYIDYRAQETILERVHAALAVGGVLIVREADAAAGIRFLIGKCVDATVVLAQQLRAPRLYFRSASEWLSLLKTSGFNTETVPMSAGTPFANVMLIARRQ